MPQRVTTRPRPGLDSIPFWCAAAAALAVPLAVVVALTHGLRDTITTFHGSDETIYHLPVIEQFLRVWPQPDWADYSSATGPLYHYLTATWATVVGNELWALRLLNVLVTWAAAVTFAVVLRRAGAPAGWSLLAAFTLLVSPYVFGPTFILLTDNLALLFVALLVLGLQAASSGRRYGVLVAAAALTLVCVTRQSFAWLVVPFVLFGWPGSPSAAALARRAGLAVAALLPLAALALVWGGLVPPTLRVIHEGAVSPRNVVFALAVCGVFAVALFARQVGAAARTHRRVVAMGAAAGVVLLAALPLSAGAGDDGWLWRVSRATPTVFGSSLVFFPLLAIAGATVAVLLVVARRWAATATLLLFLTSLAANATSYQKYVDPVVLGALLLLAAPAVVGNRLERVGLILLAAAGAAYFVIQQ